MSVRREKIQIGFHTHLAHFQEQFLGRSGHRKTVGTAPETSGVLVRPEKADLSVPATESLKPLKAGITLVKHPGESVEMEIEIVGKLGFRPLPVAVEAEDNGVCLSVTEAEAPPVKFVHINTLIIVLYQLRDLVTHL